MRALVPTGRAGELVTMAEVPEPEPRPDEAVVRVEAFSVNRGEIFRLENAAPGGRPGTDTGGRPGKDVAGVVVQAAADGTGPAVGQRVTGHPEAGGWAEYAAIPTGSLAVLPPEVTMVQGAALPLAGLTALRLLRSAGGLAGRRILLTGASGGVGHYLTELAAAAGAEVTAVTSSAARGQRLAELGATAVVRDLDGATGPFDLVLESTGGDALAAAVNRLVPGGTLIWFGQASRTPATLDFFTILGGPQTVTVRTFVYWDSPVGYGRDLATLAGLVAAGALHPEIGRVTGWAGTAAVLTDLYHRRIRGNAVLTIDPGRTAQKEENPS
jgi:NADPH:quinone reductase